jgi:glycosyltransferase involved in cell wall biosynthesis
MNSMRNKLIGRRVALMLPCLNEGLTIGKVIRDFRHVLPSLEIYVFDNGSTDRSAEIARAEGAKVISVCRRGKGHVVRKMFESVEADIYVMVDSDDTYDAKGLLKLMEPVLEDEADMVVGSRLTDHSPQAFRKFHRFGNFLIIRLINLIFGSQLTDILSGYRVMSRQFVKNIPFMRDGFEVETELTVYSLIYGFVVKEIALSYRQRPANSHSKLKTFSDGYKVLLTIIWLARDLRPLLFFASASLFIFLLGAVPLRLLKPDSLFWQLTLAMVSISLATTGLILNSVHIRFQEIQLLARRNQPAKVVPSVHLDSFADHPTATDRLSA